MQFEMPVVSLAVIPASVQYARKKMFHTSHSLDLITKTESVIILGCFLRDVSVTKIWFGIVGLQSRTVASC